MSVFCVFQPGLMSGVVSSSTAEGSVVSSGSLHEMAIGDDSAQWPTTTTTGVSTVIGSVMSPFTKFGSDVPGISPDSTARQIKTEVDVDAPRLELYRLSLCYIYILQFIR